MEKIFQYPLISIIIVNLNGKDYLGTCLDSIKNLNYPEDRFEVTVVDNGSSDGSVQFLAGSYPGIKVIKNDFNKGFAVANNQGARVANGEYVAFLNNDTKVDVNWLIELVKPVYKDKETVCAGSKVLSMDGKTLDFVGGMVNFEGKGFQIDYSLDRQKDIYDDNTYLPFVNGGAMLVNRQVFLDAGGFDEDFFAYYEDVDFGWRLWVLGYRVVFAPKSIVYHVHHGTSKIFSEDKLRFLKERNALYSVFKNYDDENLAKVFSGTLASIYNRIFVDVKFDYKKYYDFTLKPVSAVQNGAATVLPSVSIDMEPLSSLMAVKSFFDELPKLREKRSKIQSGRKRDDKAVFAYFKGQFLSVSPDLQYQRNQIDILKSLGIYEIFEKQIKRTILIISSEIVSKDMAGPAIRVWNFAKILSEHMNVILAIPNENNMAEQVFRVVQYKDESSLKNLIGQSDILLCGGMTFSRFGCIGNSGKYIIMDIYDPYNLATLVEYKNEGMERQLDIYKSVHFFANEMLYFGDFFICASERQRDFWMGMLAALNRVNPYSYYQDPQMRKLIDVVPFGLPSNKPAHTRQVLKGVIKGIEKDDFVIIWGGGIYNWFDPLTLIRAMAKIKDVRKDIKLYFLGVKHPNPQVKELSLVTETVELARKLDVLDKNVFFNFGWIEYDQRQDYLLESDAGIITHPNHIETRFAFRTRILDYFWAGLPVISTSGDSLSELVEKEGLGVTVAAGDVDGLTDAIISLVDNKPFILDCRDKVATVSQDYTWEKICGPIIEFCKDPVFSAYRKKLKPDQIYLGTDVLDLSQGSKNVDSLGQSSKKSKYHIFKRFFYHLFRSGPKKTLQFSSNYVREKKA
jgi:GT2 family glycosyltransferase